MENYVVNIKETSAELTAKERIKIKDTTNAIKLDEATKDEDIKFTPEFYAVLSVHNDKATGDKDYEQYVVVATDGRKFCTGSKSFWQSFKSIVDEMYDADEEDYEIVVTRKDSKNYTGKQFLSCSIA